MKVPLKKLQHKNPTTDRFQDHVEEAINKLGVQTLDDWPDGTVYRRVLGVNAANLLTNSGIATSTITAQKILTVSGTSLLAGTVPVSALGTCNQFSVYRNAAQSCPAGVYSALYADKTVKDVGGGWSAANAWYVIPTAGDWQFMWSMAIAPTNAGTEVFSALVINSGLINGSVAWNPGAGQYIGSFGTYLYCNALVGDKIKAQVFNGDSGSNALKVGSGINFFQGYQLR